MRSKFTLPTLCASVLALSFATGAEAQPGDPGGAPGAAQPANPGLTVTLGGGTSAPGDPTQDTGPTEELSEEEEGKDEPLPWRGTSFVVSQSFTTQTVGVGADFQSDNPTYEVLASFRPRYYLLDGDVHSIYASLRIDATREFTNSDFTTKQQETLLRNTILDLVYGAKVYQQDGWVTQVGGGPRMVLPTDKYAYRGGNRLRLGGGLRASQLLPLAGSDSTWFPSLAIQSSMYYLKHLNTSTTATSDSFTRERQDVAGRSLPSNQISGRARVNHELTPVIGAALNITSKLHLAANYVWIMQWAYGFDDVQVDITSGSTTPTRVEDPRTNRVTPWVLVGLDYDVIPEVAIGAGYYNATDQIGPGGTRRSPLWSPDARIFFDITANLDEIYITASGNRKDKAASRAWTRQQARINGLDQSSW